MKNSVLLVLVLVAIVLYSVPHCGASDAAKARPAKDSVRWDLESFKHIVHPMKHSTAGRPPIMLWNVPLPRGDEPVKCGDQCLLRTFTLGKSTVPLKIELFDGVSVTVEASPAGTTYLVAKNGVAQKLEMTADK